MLIAFLTMAALAIQQPEVKRVPSLTGDITLIPAFESKVLSNKRRVWVYLPPNYAKEPSRRYPVLYCHDGQNVFDGATSFIANKEWRIDESAEGLIKAGLIEPIIIVAIANAEMERGNEYLPTSIKMGSSQVGGKADLYGQFLLQELKLFIDKSYRTKPEGKNTAMLGSSFGGVITYYLGISNPSSFGMLGVISPSVWVNNRELVRRTADLPKKLDLRVWIDMGSREAPSAMKDASDMAAAMTKKGWVLGKDLVFYEDGFAEHNEEAWARRVPAILIWMFGRRRLMGE